MVYGGLGGVYNGLPFVKNRKTHAAHKRPENDGTFLPQSINHMVNAIKPPGGGVKRKSVSKTAIKRKTKAPKPSVTQKEQVRGDGKNTKQKIKKRKPLPKDRF